MFDWIVSVLESAELWGVAFLMLIENLIPPIPSEVIMPIAGFVASRGDNSLIAVVAAGTFGSLLGTTAWYFMGRQIGQQRLESFARRHGRWLTMTPDDIEKATAWFVRYGPWALVLGRLVPGVRTFISVPAGVAGLSLPKFLFYSTIGTALWTALLAIAGYWLGQDYMRVSQFVEPASNIIMAGAALIYLYRLLTFRPTRMS